ncbi:MAG TPA: hypothetical protein VH063_11510 [Gaiellaceae bacterium]|jgi:hypothetical protein|nr:hypothetical protein [Gaiellaceae bacterium]
MAKERDNAIFELGRFDPRVVRELAALPEPVRQLRAVDEAAAELGEDVRIYTGGAEAASLMATIVALRRFDVALCQADGHWHIDVRAGDGVIGAIVDLVAAAIDRRQLSFATVCIGKRTLSFYPSPSGQFPAVAA